ncbi:chromosome partitioning protein ParB [Mycobacterium paraffinicum]|uniref:Chromosome partitioning protein ParB n=1 Tax=Mycobacterium paraffinicum TaxID=53378 RepID=A0A1Q4HH21_9MYCO|nr:ParB/RepB/Spo0J family partition protein [Mycobacterium paraffinicum]OJZ66785.1 chromosome partitioning protein ParB [Mycobacterium paraffinicum]
MAQTTARPARRAKPAGRKTANRFAMLAGGDTAPSTDPSPATDSAASEEGTGLIAGMSAIVANEAHRVVQIHVAEIAPHPFNDPRRSQPQPGDPKWEELLNGVRASGVRLPVLVVTREAFMAARPSTADSATDARYVLVYGHRRRIAAIEAGRDTVPAVVDDAIMVDDGDLDAMATENLGRQDLSDLAEGELYARYSEIGLSQRAIAERLGVDQATVSRKLALKLLAPEVRDAVDDGRLPSAEAAALAGKLPYGPPRRWQKTKDPDQLSDLRHKEQMQALHLILTRGMIATRAAERVIAERTARAKADELRIPLVEDPRAELGENYQLHRVADYEPDAEVIGAINPASGALDLYARHLAGEELTSTTSSIGDAAAADPPDQPGAPEVLDPPTESDAPPPREETDQDPGQSDEPTPDAAQRQADAQAAAQAQRARREFCAVLINQQPSNAELLKILVAQYLSGVAARSATSAVSALLRDWDATADGPAEKARNARAWHRAVAAAELHTAELKDKAWDDDAAAHVNLLINRAGYQPTPWERRQLEAAGA